MGLGGFGMWEMIFIFLVVLLLFGAKRLPEIGGALGKGIREFKGSIREIEHELKVPDGRNQIHQSSPPPQNATASTASTASTATTDGEPRSLSDD